MNRNRLLIIFGAAWVSAALLTWFLYASTKAPKTEKMSEVVAAAHDMPAGTVLKEADVKKVKVVDRDLPKTAIRDIQLVVRRPLLFPVNANEPLSAAKVASVTGPEGLPSTIKHGMRAISVPVTDASSVAGLVQPRARVDVLFTRTGSMAEAVTTTILEDVEVMSIGRNTEVSSAQTDPRAARPQAQAATLLVTPEQARKLELAKNQGKISLALRNPLDHAIASESTPTTAEDLNVGPYLGRRGRGPNLRDNRYWAGLTGDSPDAPSKRAEKKEPAKPRFVVDVFRGDKHVQEIFQ
jgi:pilus assembly protein CpaB